MIEPAIVRDQPALVRAALQNRGLQAEAVMAELAALDERRRALIVEVEGLKREQNAAGE